LSIHRGHERFECLGSETGVDDVWSGWYGSQPGS